MNFNQIETIASLRLLVGYLGEKEQFGWWQSSFFTQGSNAFLSPLFARTQLLAQCNGVTQAAALVHDERIGVGHVYHLFRLPEDLEQSIHQALHNEASTKAAQTSIATKQAALGNLLKLAERAETEEIGPVRIGDLAALRDPRSWRFIAGYYLAAFEKDQKTFPYFADRT
jgi:hypothetical protein